VGAGPVSPPTIRAVMRSTAARSAASAEGGAAGCPARRRGFGSTGTSRAYASGARRRTNSISFSVVSTSL